MSLIDRAASERGTHGLIDALRREESTRVLMTVGDTAPIGPDGGLVWCAPSAVPTEARWAFLGRAEGGAGLLVAAFRAGTQGDVVRNGQWQMLRVIGGELSEADADAFATAVGLGHWLYEFDHCPACGAGTDIDNAGWSRRCTSCAREHFPRTDPAVIVAITSPEDPDVLLLGSNALWGAGRYSCFAGFVEVGESLEDAVRREMEEEAGVVVDRISYRGSQAWPYPRSLMLGFLARARNVEQARPDGEEIVDVRWFHRDEVRAAFAGSGDVTLPPTSSIAHRLISGWLDDAE